MERMQPIGNLGAGGQGVAIRQASWRSQANASERIRKALFSPRVQAIEARLRALFIPVKTGIRHGPESTF